MYLVICEDEDVFANELSAELEHVLREKQVACHIGRCKTGAELKRLLDGAEPVDLLFMDIHLEKEDGVELVKELSGNHVPTVFLTSLESRIADGYDVNALHFLFKRNYKEKLPGLLERFLNEIYRCKSVVVSQHELSVMLQISEIYYVEPDNRSTAVYTADAGYSDRRPIQMFVKLLPEDMFIEAYKSLFINIDHIRKVYADFVTLDNGRELPVSRRKRKELMTAVMRRMQAK